MNSMTGFGKAELTTRIGRFTVEISSVNSRFLEVTARLPRQYSLLEHRLRELAASRIVRGKVNIFVGFEEPEDAPHRFLISRTAFKKYYQQLSRLKRELKLAGDIRISDLMVLPDISQPEDTTLPLDVVWPGIRRATFRAMKELLGMRRQEGAALVRDMSKRLTAIEHMVKKIKAGARLVVQKYRDRLSTRIAELLETNSVDESRIEQEVALMADRSDISEECTRLTSHIDQFKKSLRSREPIGKRLNFILQEMNREANTMSSKCSETTVINTVIAVKEEIEKLREQVQNVE